MLRHANQARDGTHTATNSITNNLDSCTDPTRSNIASLTTFNYAPGAPSFGIGLSNFQSLTSPSFPITDHELFVNGADMGVLEILAGANWSPGFTRNAYLRIDTTGGSVITSVGFENLTTNTAGVPDFLMFDRLAIAAAVPEPLPTSCCSPV